MVILFLQCLQSLWLNVSYDLQLNKSEPQDDSDDSWIFPKFWLQWNLSMIDYTITLWKVDRDFVPM